MSDEPKIDDTVSIPVERRSVEIIAENRSVVNAANSDADILSEERSVLVT